MASLWKDKVFTLCNEIRMPAIGLGTFRLKGQETIDLAVSEALNQGYRHIDTASVYRNEGQIAETLQKENYQSNFLFSYEIGLKI